MVLDRNGSFLGILNKQAVGVSCSFERKAIRAEGPEMQVLALTTSLRDMRERLGKMVIGSSKAGAQSHTLPRNRRKILSVAS